MVITACGMNEALVRVAATYPSHSVFMSALSSLCFPGAASALSGFLTGIDVNVPVTHNIHHYDDLAERAQPMDDILSASGFRLLGLRSRQSRAASVRFRPCAQVHYSPFLA
jgi:hypothetical protein